MVHQKGKGQRDKTWGESNVIRGDKKEEPREFKEKPASPENMEK